MSAPNRTTTLWVIATFALAVLPQLSRMPAAVAAMTVIPLAWRVASEFRGWKPLPAAASSPASATTSSSRALLVK